MNTTTRTPAARRFWLEHRASDCYDWLTPDEVVRHALGAYYMASRALDHLPEDHAGDGTFNNGRFCFAEDVLKLLEMRLSDHGFKKGAPGFDNWAAAELRKHTPEAQKRRVAEYLRSADYLGASQLPVMRTGHDIHCTFYILVANTAHASTAFTPRGTSSRHRTANSLLPRDFLARERDLHAST